PRTAPLCIAELALSKPSADAEIDAEHVLLRPKPVLRTCAREEIRTVLLKSLAIHGSARPAPVMTGATSGDVLILPPPSHPLHHPPFATAEERLSSAAFHA